ncbi:UNVERIFIED_CONTAM: hypothetical protein K2H54_053568 [Gekko kuhli]
MNGEKAPDSWRQTEIIVILKPGKDPEEGRRHHLHCLNALCRVCGAHGRGGRATLPFPKEAVALKVKEIMRDSFFSIEPKSLLAMRAVGELRIAITVRLLPAEAFVHSWPTEEAVGVAQSGPPEGWRTSLTPKPRSPANSSLRSAGTRGPRWWPGLWGWSSVGAQQATKMLAARYAEDQSPHREGAEPLVGRAAGGLARARAVSWPGMLRRRDRFLPQPITYWMRVKRPAHRAGASGLMASILLDTSRLPSFNEGPLLTPSPQIWLVTKSCRARQEKWGSLSS